MKQYQEINYYGDYWGLSVVAFDKIDGSNLRFEYSQKRGFYKSGTRNMMIDNEHAEFGFAVNLFLEKYSENLLKVFKGKDYRNSMSFVCYAELIGKKSEFGQHLFGEDEFDIVLFDVDEHKKGFIPPRKFVKDFDFCGIPKIVYEGNLNKDFVQSVKKNNFRLSEGVICKGLIPNKKENNLFYCKIKTDEWFERLRSKNPQLYQEELKQANRKPIDIQL